MRGGGGGGGGGGLFVLLVGVCVNFSACVRVCVSLRACACVSFFQLFYLFYCTTATCTNVRLWKAKNARLNSTKERKSLECPLKAAAAPTFTF